MILLSHKKKKLANDFRLCDNKYGKSLKKYEKYSIIVAIKIKKI